MQNSYAVCDIFFNILANNVSILSRTNNWQIVLFAK